MFDKIDESQSGKRFIPAPNTFRHPDTDRNTRFRTPGSRYSDRVARNICRRIMEGGALKRICEDPLMPSWRTVTLWLSDSRMTDFREMYYHARRVQAELLIDDIFEIANDSGNDWVETHNKKGEANGWKPDYEAIQRSRLKIDTIKWYAAKMMPRIYGEKVDVQHEIVGDLAAILKKASNQDAGLPKPIDVPVLKHE